MYFYHMHLLLPSAVLARTLSCFAVQFSLYLGAEYPTLWEGNTYSAQQHNFKTVNSHRSKLDNTFYEPMFNFHMTKSSPLWSHNCFIAIGMSLQLLLTLLNGLLTLLNKDSLFWNSKPDWCWGLWRPASLLKMKIGNIVYCKCTLEIFHLNLFLSYQFSSSSTVNRWKENAFVT